MSPKQFNDTLAQVLEIVKQANATALEGFARRHELSIDCKGHHDWVSEVDRSVEADICTALSDAFPDHYLFGEETGGEYQFPCWVIDPIDGTTNFLYGQADFAVSIALVDEQGPLLGVIGTPIHGRIFYALRDQGAFELRDNEVKPLQPRAMAAEKLVVGLNLNYHDGVAARYLAHTQQLIEQGHQIRVNGSAAWALTQVANGELDGCYLGLVNVWDVAAAQLICQEAGLEIAPYLSDTTGTVWAWPKQSPLRFLQQ